MPTNRPEATDQVFTMSRQIDDYWNPDNEDFLVKNILNLSDVLWGVMTLESDETALNAVSNCTVRLAHELGIEERELLRMVAYRYREYCKD